MNSATFTDYPLFDSHFHIIDKRFPLIPNNGYLPGPFSTDDYLKRLSGYSLCGGAIVSGSFQGFEQRYLLAALQAMGPSYVGVTQLPHTAPDEQILALASAGVRAVRFNLKRGGSEDIRHLQAMASRVYELAGWHIELYLDASTIDSLYPVLASLPSLSIDHLGLSHSGYHSLLRLAEKGVKIKASGFGRVDFALASALTELFRINPEALLFGTDLPSTRAARAYRDEDFILIVETLGPDAARKVFAENALQFYKPNKR